MPLYEYTCTNCNHEFELIQKFGDKPARKCPACGKSRAKKKISLAGFQLKGGGWYSDGYSKAPSSDAADSAKNNEKSIPKESDKKSDKKNPDKQASAPSPTQTKNQAA